MLEGRVGVRVVVDGWVVAATCLLLLPLAPLFTTRGR